MAHQDYVSRPRSAPKNNRANQAPAHAPLFSLKFKLVLLITLLAIGGFSYFLWKIKDNGSTSAIEPSVPPETQQEVTKLPEPPKDKWSYRKNLENKEVAEGHYDVEQGGPYQMQCGSFKTRKQAEVLKANIAFVGIEAQIKETNGRNGTWYKVVLGPYERKRLAEKDKHKLKNNNVNYCQIWLWQ